MYKIIRFLLLVFSSAIALFHSDIFIIASVYFYVLAVFILMDFLKKKTFTLFQIWQIGFIYIILSEMLLLDYSRGYLLSAVQYLILANNFVILGYLCPFKTPNFTLKEKDFGKRKNWVLFLIILLDVFYVAYQLPRNLVVFVKGRSGEIAETSVIMTIIGPLIEAIGYILPAVIAFYFSGFKGKKSFLFPLLLSLPIFFTLFVSGTRFPLLFAFSGFALVVYSKTKGTASRLRLIIMGILLFTAANFMTDFRARGYGNTTNMAVFEDTATNKLFLKSIASQMSPEGVVDMTTLMFRYFESNPHLYGQSSSFLLYFWVPREIWPDKPTMLGHWLIRQYRSGLAEGHSSSFGFSGELFSDFGYFSLLGVFVFGVLLHRLDKFREFYLSKPGTYKKILIAMLFPYVFFFIRSPITATMNFIGILVMYWFFKRIFRKKGYRNSEFTAS